MMSGRLAPAPTTGQCRRALDGSGLTSAHGGEPCPMGPAWGPSGLAWGSGPGPTLGGISKARKALQSEMLRVVPGPGDSGLRSALPSRAWDLKNPMDRGARQATVHGVAESDMTE